MKELKVKLNADNTISDETQSVLRSFITNKNMYSRVEVALKDNPEKDKFVASDGRMFHRDTQAAQYKEMQANRGIEVEVAKFSLFSE